MLHSYMPLKSSHRPWCHDAKLSCPPRHFVRLLLDFHRLLSLTCGPDQRKCTKCPLSPNPSHARRAPVVLPLRRLLRSWSSSTCSPTFTPRELAHAGCLLTTKEKGMEEGIRKREKTPTFSYREGYFRHFSWSGPHVRASKRWKCNRRWIELRGGQESLASWH